VTRVLDRVHGPADLRALGADDLATLATEIRDLLVQTISTLRTGHLGPNLGAVELTIALHRVFDSPTEPILWDVGHQAYVHKILTGRADRMATLRQGGGLSGYPSRAESEHDWIENSHASTALSYADGMAKAHEIRGDRRPIVAVVGDGALTGGMCWEALNNIAASDRPVIVVVNDNGRSYSPTIGGLAEQLAGLRLSRGYERVLEQVKHGLPRVPVVGSPIYDALHGVKRGIKDVLQPQRGMFEDLGLKYFGPVDGHDIAAMETAFGLARNFGGPVIVHCVTRKGFGYAPAENDEADQLHQWRPIDPKTGVALPKSGRSWTGVFADELAAQGERREDVVAITAAMCDPTGLRTFEQRFPERTFDVGIAEQHAVTSAAGLASGGLHPVVAIYATFLNRAFDQVLMDVALHRLPVTFVLDRAGVTGDDGPSHNGMWDLALLGIVPGLRMAAPRDEATLRERLDRPHRPAFPEDAAGRPAARSASRRHRRRAARAGARRGGRRAGRRGRCDGGRRPRGCRSGRAGRLHRPGRLAALGQPRRPRASAVRAPQLAGRDRRGRRGRERCRRTDLAGRAACRVRRSHPRDRPTGTVPRTRQRRRGPVVGRPDRPGHRSQHRRMAGDGGTRFRDG
jgi:1-deoxy-D-xylulose-5-phosphate synthase